MFKKIDFQDAVWILQSGEYYLLQEEPLQAHCENVLENGINSENWFDAFVLGIKLENEDLQNAAQKMMPRVAQEKLLGMMKAKFQKVIIESMEF